MRGRILLSGLDFSYAVETPIDSNTGLPAGKRQHKPIVITKAALGPASPQLFQALVTNEMLKTVMISFVQRDDKGVAVVYYTVRLTTAHLTSYRIYFGTPPAAPHRRCSRSSAWRSRKSKSKARPER